MTGKMQKKKSLPTILSREEYLRQLAASDTPLDICLTNNYAFRKTFKNKTALKGFIMSLLRLRSDQVIDLEIIDPYEAGEDTSEKEGILDVKIHLNNNQKINLEMQNRYQDDWSERSIFYNCRMFTEGFLHGMPYGSMEPCIHVGILDFDQMKNEGFHHIILLQDEQTGEIYSSKFLFHVIELSKLEAASVEENDLELYHWARLIAAKSWEAVCMEAKGNHYMEAAVSEMDKINQSEKERYLYLRQEMALSDEKSRLLTAEKKGRSEGLAEGLSRGITQGIDALILDNLEDGKSTEQILEKLVKRFSLDMGEAKKYFEQCVENK